MTTYFLKENLLSWKTCTIDYIDEGILTDHDLLLIKGMPFLFDCLKKANGNSLPKNLDVNYLVRTKLGVLFRFKKDDARIIVFTIAKKNYILVVGAWKKDEETYKIIDTSAGLKIIINKVKNFLKKKEKKEKEEQQTKQEQTKKKPKLVNVSPSEDGKSLLLSYDDNSKYRCPLKKIITKEANRHALLNKDFLSTLTVADNHVFWDDQKGGIYISIGEIRSNSQKLTEYLDFLEEAMEMSSYPEYERLYEEYLRYYNEPCLKG